MAETTIVYRVHALQRMFERAITQADVREALRTGEVIELYPDDQPYPSRLILALVRGRPVHVVVAEDRDAQRVIIITAYEPDLDRWEPGFRHRRKP